MSTDNQLKRAFDGLTRCHEAIRSEFAKIRPAVYKEYLGKLDSQLRRQVKKYGDGHALYSLPGTVDELKQVDAVVLFAVTSPKLSETSDFNPFTPLHEIHYWRDGKGLSPWIYARNEQYRLHFMSWQQNFAISGENDSDARKNYKLLVETRPNLQGLFQKEKEASILFVYRCGEWLESNRKRMCVITHSSRSEFEPPISSLIANPNVSHIKANLRGNNRQIMGRIGEELERIKARLARREKAMSFVGKALDSQTDVAERHDHYLYDEYACPNKYKNEQTTGAVNG